MAVGCHTWGIGKVDLVRTRSIERVEDPSLRDAEPESKQDGLDRMKTDSRGRNEAVDSRR